MGYREAEITLGQVTIRVNTEGAGHPGGGRYEGRSVGIELHYGLRGGIRRKVEVEGRHLENPFYVNLEGMDELADIIVRGIRSLEEDRAAKATRPGQDDDYRFDDAADHYDKHPVGHGAG